MTLLNADQLGAVLEATRRTLFRMETLPAYVSPSASDFERWRAGEPEPTWSRKQPWLDTLTRWAGEGRPRSRVRIVHDPITDYERFACDWGYRLNAQAGEQIRVLDLAAISVPSELDAAPGDWWLIDNREVVWMHYDPEGAFLGAEILDPRHTPRHRAAMDATWRVAEDFTVWWHRHQEHRRSARQET